MSNAPRTHGEDQRLRHPERYRQRREKTAARGYGGRWQKLRAWYLGGNPLCVRCLAQSRTVAATVVDHIVPHKGDEALLFDEGNMQSLCKRCHDRKTATEDGAFGNRKAARADD